MFSFAGYESGSMGSSVRPAKEKINIFKPLFINQLRYFMQKFGANIRVPVSC